MARKKVNQKTKKKVNKAAKKHPVFLCVIVILLVAVVGCYLLHSSGIIYIPLFDVEESSSSLDDSSIDSSSSSSSPDDSSIDSSSSSSSPDDSSIDSSSSSSSLDDSSIDSSSSSSSADDSSIDSSSSSSSPDDSSIDDFSSSSSSSSPDDTPIVNDELSIHFLELGNQYTGDCTLIKVGDTEVLIDAGSRQGSAATIVPYIKEYCTDGILEYVIATHAHQDHIAGFVGTQKAAGIFESFVCETIIDYTQTNSNSQIRKNYEKYRDAEVAAGATHYTVLECWNNENGAQRSYELGEGITMNFLYQKYYEQKTSDENNYSVCMLLTQGDDNYLFTGDLESGGEKSLLESNDLPKCKLFKAGHHGSPTSSTAALLAAIQPEIVCVCCCCGSTEYTNNMENTFPSQAFVDRIAPYTDKIYVTTLISDDGKKGISMNGNIVVYTENGTLKVRCSNNTTLFKDTEWFKANRTLPNAWK